jgi:hypothetical protein
MREISEGFEIVEAEPDDQFKDRGRDLVPAF